MVLLKYLSFFCRTLKMPLINREINLILSWFAKCVIVTYCGNSSTNICNNWYKTLCSSYNFILQKTETKNLQKLTLQINFTKNWNQVSIGRPNQYLDYLIDPSFQRVDRLFVLSFENNDLRTSFKQYFLPYVDYDVMINERNFWSTLKII